MGYLFTGVAQVSFSGVFKTPVTATSGNVELKTIFRKLLWKYEGRVLSRNCYRTNLCSFIFQRISIYFT